MAAGQDFLTLCNVVLRRFNEVELTASTLPSCRGFHAQVKDAVNASIRDINSIGAKWPFNYVTVDAPLTIGQARYAFPADAKVVDAAAFRLLRDPDNAINETQYLQPCSIDDWHQRFAADEEAGDDANGVPKRAAITRNLEWIVNPPPNAAYTVRYEYYAQPADLSAATDETSIPLPYRFVIIDGATFHCHVFRSDLDAANMMRKAFENGLKDMRRNMINRDEYARSTLSI